MAWRRRLSFTLSTTTIRSTGRVVSPVKHPEATTEESRPELLRAATMFSYRTGEASCTNRDNARKYLNSAFRIHALSVPCPLADLFPRVFLPFAFGLLPAFFIFLIILIFFKIGRAACWERGEISVVA